MALTTEDDQRVSTLKLSHASVLYSKEDKDSVVVRISEHTVLDTTHSEFPITVRFGDKEYIIVKSQFNKLMLNRKDR